MPVTIIGTGNMARGAGSRVLARGHDLAVVGKDAERAEEAAGELAGAGEVDTATAGAPLAGDVIVLAVYCPDARGSGPSSASAVKLIA